MEPATLYESVPLILSLVLVGAFLFFIAAYVLSRVRPPTDEPVIGYYRFMLKGLGRTVSGLTTTARTALEGAHRLEALSALSQKFPEIFLEKLGDLHFYAVKEGRKKTLVLSTRNVETSEYSDSERGRRFLFPHGWVSYRNVYGYGVEVSPRNSPDLFRLFKGEWDSVVFIYPENLKSRTNNPTALMSAEKLAEAVFLLKEAALQQSRVRALEDVLRVEDRTIKRLQADVAEAWDRARLAERRALLTTPFASEREEEKRRGLLPAMTKWRLLTIILAGAFAYWYLPQHTRLMPNSSAVLGAVGAWLFWFAYDNWIKERL